MQELAEESIDISLTSGSFAVPQTRRSTRVVLTLIAAVSALAGGLAAAWYYRKTISQLQHAELNEHNSKFGISDATDDDGL